MTIAVVMALASSVGWGISDFLGGLRSRALGLLPVLIVSQVAALVLLAGFVGLAGPVPPDAPHLLAAAAAGVSEAVGVAALYRGLAVGRASVVAPVAAAAPVVPFAVGLVLGQVPGSLQIGGLVLVVAGIVLAAHQRRSEGGGTGVAVLHGALSAVGFGAFFVFMDAAFHPVVTIGLAATLLRERIDAVQRAGVATAVLGVVAVTAG